MRASPLAGQTKGNCSGAVSGAGTLGFSGVQEGEQSLWSFPCEVLELKEHFSKAHDKVFKMKQITLLLD